MHFYQRRFFAYLHGSPNLHTLNTVSSHTYTLVTTDRCVSLLRYGDEGYSLQKLEIGTNLNDEVEIMASAVFERSAMLQSQIAVAYAVGESFFLQIVSYHDDCLGNVVDCGKFEIEAASACMFSVKAAGLNGDIFYGVIVCCTDVVMAFGYIENERDTSTTTSSAVCTRLDNEQLALYFSELATFSHTILTVDVFTTPEKDQGWVALGCADGLVRVLHGSMHRGCLGGPYKSKDVQQNGPVTSVALFPQQTFSMENESSTWICNMLVTCAIGQAVVYEDLYSTSDEDWNNEVLMDSDTFDTILVGITADIDFDGKVELLLGTDSQVMLAYKMSTDIDEEVTEDVKSDVYSNDSASPSSHDSSHNIWNDIETMSDTGEKSCPSELARSLIPRRKWHRLSRRHWNLETFGYIYSLLWRDINDDGVPELIIASSTGIYVYEADPIFVIDKLRNVLAALEIYSLLIEHMQVVRRRQLVRNTRLLSVRGTSTRFKSVSAAASVDLNSRAKPGLFQLPNLHAPSDFLTLTHDVKLQCHELRQKLVKSPPGLQTLRTLDDISNAICSVIDAAELCRNVHPNENFRQAASECFTDLSDFIQNLNADTNLYQSLKSVTENTITMNSFTPEQRRMGILLRQEFERDGIHLSRSDRKRAISLQNDITQLSMQFQSTMLSARDYVDVPAKFIRGLPHSITSVCERKWMSPDTLRVPTDTHVMNTILKWVSAPEIRRKMYIAANTCAKDNLLVLDKLREKRHELAQLLGFASYAHFATSDRMITSLEDVKNFIDGIAKQLMSKAKAERQLLLNAKRKHEGQSVDQLYMWDVPYYTGILKAQMHLIDSRVISAYFPLENCIKGLRLVCSALFDLELKQIPMLNASESWHEDVVKLALIGKGEILGYIYFDLYPRANKYNHAAHFTIRCGKRLSETSYQKPIVALVCNFSKDSPSLLTHAEVETLFHEFGHAMHSLLSHSEFQHLSGTRAMLDFVETPSHLFEYFAWDYQVVSEFARHHETDAPLPAAMMQGLRASKRMFAAMDTQTQCLYSMLDLQLFGEQPLPCTPPTTTQMLQQLQNSSTLVPHVCGTSWHTRFGHLIGYGAGYYSYLYARVFASDIWHTCFVGSKGPLNREAGEKLYKKLMIHGGAKDPNELLLDMLGRKPSPANYLQELGV